MDCVGPVLFSQPGKRPRCGSLIHQHIWTGSGMGSKWAGRRTLKHDSVCVLAPTHERENGERERKTPTGRHYMKMQQQQPKKKISKTSRARQQQQQEFPIFY